MYQSLQAAALNLGCRNWTHNKMWCSKIAN